MAIMNFGDLVATTIESRNKKAADNVTNNNAILYQLKKAGSIKTFNGGTSIREEMLVQANGNTGSYSLADTLSTAIQDTVDAAYFGIKQYYTNIVTTGLELAVNTGDAAIIDLAAAKAEVAEASLTNQLVTDIYGDGTGNGGKAITGLQAAVPISNATGTYGGYDRSNAANVFWRNQKFKCSTDGLGGNAYLSKHPNWYEQLVGKASSGCRPTNLRALSNPAYWALYMASLQANQRFVDNDLASAGFTNVQFLNAPIILETSASGVPASTLYLLNSKFLRWRPSATVNFTMADPKGSVNQDVSVRTLLWYGNMTCRGAQFQGIMQN